MTLSIIKKNSNSNLQLSDTTYFAFTLFYCKHGLGLNSQFQCYIRMKITAKKVILLHKKFCYKKQYFFFLNKKNCYFTYLISTINFKK